MSDEQITKDEHYVPKFLLKNFTERDGKLCQYNFKYNNYSRKTPSQICYRKFVYETKLDGRGSTEEKDDFVYINRIEKYFKTKEDIYAPCIRSVLDICNNPENTSALVCSATQKEILASFSANLLLRNPVIMDTAELGIKDSKLWQSNTLTKTIKMLKLFGIDNLDSIELAAKKDVWFNEELDNSAQSIIKKQIFQNMSFNFFVSNQAHYIITDFPFSYHVDFEKRTLNVLNIPLSPTCLLSLVHKKIDISKNNRIAYVDDEMVCFINKLMLKNHKNPLEHIYAKKQDDIEELLRYIGDNHD